MTFSLPRLPQALPNYSQVQVWWQQVVEKVESQEGSQDDVLTALAAVQADQAALLAQLQEAQRRLAIGGSYTKPTVVLTATDAGSSATVTIAAHIRYYADETSLAVAGATFTGKAYSTTYAVYYDDPTLQDGTPDYILTTTLESAQNNVAPGRHYVGTVKTPAAAGAAIYGGSVPPGSGYRYDGTGYYL